MKKRFYIYKITFLKGRLKGKYYIGMHTTTAEDLVNDGYFGSGNVANKYYKKYTPAIRETITKEILEECDSKEQLAEREKFWIGDLWETDKLCVNLKSGGEGGWDFCKGKHLTEIHKEKIRNGNKGNPSAFKGRKHSLESISKMSISHKGHPGYNKGCKRDEKTKNKISISKKGTKWINNNIEQKCVKPEFLEQYLAEGWVLGRLPNKKKAAKQAA